MDNFWINWMSIKITGEDIPGTLAFLESEYHKANAGARFDYSFYEDEIDALYTNEKRFLRIFIIFSVLAILIASLGILGLASYSVAQRTREIGIRKVAGSTAGWIILLISREFAALVLIANLIAWPVAWYFMRNWLMDFPYKIHLGFLYFLISALVALLIGMITVTIQAWRAATMNPAAALRYE